MRKLRVALDITLVLAVLMTVVISFIPSEARAACWYPERMGWTYTGYIVNGVAQCNMPIVSPPMPSSTVGEHIQECDGSTTQWGIVCANATYTREFCAPICE